MFNKIKSVLIIYNLPQSNKDIQENSNGLKDHIILGDAGTLDEVKAVKNALKNIGIKRVDVFAIKSSNLCSMIKKITSSKYDIVFNLCEGFGGRNYLQGNVACILELLQVPFTGSSAHSLIITTDKVITKKILKGSGINVPDGIVLKKVENKLDSLTFPVILKPAFEDASIGIDRRAVVRNKKDFLKRLRLLLKDLKEPVIVERYIEGREINVSILRGRVLPISEIDFSRFPSNIPKIVGIEAKWIKGSFEFRNTPGICPADISKGIEKRLKQLALNSCSVLNVDGYARVDIRLDKALNPFVLEVNANPDISPSAGFFRSANADGLSYEDMIFEILMEGLNKK